MVDRLVSLQRELGLVIGEIYESSPEILHRLVKALDKIAGRVRRVANEIQAEALRRDREDSYR